MSDRDWQHAVLRDLGVAEAGMAGPRVPEPITLQPEVVPAASAAPRSALPGAAEDAPSVRQPAGRLPVPASEDLAGLAAAREPDPDRTPADPPGRPAEAPEPPETPEPTADAQVGRSWETTVEDTEPRDVRAYPPPDETPPPPSLDDIPPAGGIGPGMAGPAGSPAAEEGAAERTRTDALPADGRPGGQVTPAQGFPAHPAPPAWGATSGSTATGERLPPRYETPGAAPARSHDVPAGDSRPGAGAAGAALDPEPPAGTQRAEPAQAQGAPPGTARAPASGRGEDRAGGGDMLVHGGGSAAPVEPAAGAVAGVAGAAEGPAGAAAGVTGAAAAGAAAVWTCRRIAVTSIRGGAGKTTVASLISSLIVGQRAGQVLAVDADSALGSLAPRMGVQPAWSTHDLVLARPRTWEEAAGYLAPSAAGPWVLSSNVDGRMGGELRLDTVRTAVGGLSGYFAAAVIDCGGGIVAPLQRGIIASAHAQVFVTPSTADGVLSAHGALEWFTRNGQGGLLARTIVALVAHSPHSDADLERARQLLSSWGVIVVRVPYDRHLAAGGAIQHRSLGKATAAAAAQIAGQAFARSFEGGDS